MTKFEDLVDIITRNKNKARGKYKPESIIDNQEEELEVAGSESTKKPLIEFGDDQTDMDLIDQLYFKNKNRPLMGEFAEKWDD